MGRVEEGGVFSGVREAQAFGDIVGESEAIEDVRAQIRDVAPTAAPVLVLGESGTGKEWWPARSIA